MKRLVERLILEYQIWWLLASSHPVSAPPPHPVLQIQAAEPNT